MNIPVKDITETIELKSIMTNMFDAWFKVDCRDLEFGHDYNWGQCDRCGHDISPDCYEESSYEEG